MELTEINNWDVRDLNHALMAALMAQKLERGNTVSSTGKISTSITEPDTLRNVPAITDRTVEGANEASGINKIVTGSVLLMLEILMIVAYVILIKHNKIDYRKRMTYILLLISTPFIETVIYFMIFNDAFDPVLGGVLLAIMLLLLGGFSVCINLLITKECSTKTLVSPSAPEIFDKEYTDLHLSGMDSTLKDTTIASTVPLGTSVNTSVQSAPVNIHELRRKKQQERRKSMTLGPRLTSSPKPKSKLATSPRQSPLSTKNTSTKTPLNRSINRSLNRSITVSPMLQKCYDRINTSLERKNKQDLKSPKKKSLSPIKGKQV